MTSFCSQCGNQVRSGGKFCQSCGASAVQSNPQSAQSNPAGGQQPGAGYSPGYPSSSAPVSYSAGYQSSFPAQQGPQGQAPYGTPQRSSRTLKVVLITLVVILFLIGGSVAAVTFMVRRAVNNIVQVSEDKDGKTETVLNIPGGTRISAGGGVTEEQLGVPIYPGATAVKDGGSMSISGGNSQGQGWFGVATFGTNDAMDEVVAFYREKLGEDASTVESTQDGKRSAMFTLQSPKGYRMVTIAEDDGDEKTKIVIASVTGKSAQP
ncbi:MAG: zinc ribbon domain-containing protein [Acidobacteriota bacterium]